MTELFLKVINRSISASWLVLAVLLLRFVLKKAPKWVSVLLWGIVAVRLICPFSFESTLSLIPSAEIIPSQAVSGQDFDVQTGFTPIDRQINGYLQERVSQAASAPASNHIPVMTVAAAVWVLGMMLLLAYTAISYWRLNRKVDTAVRYRFNIFRSEHVASPFVLGILRPRIYLPFQMDGQTVEYVVAHERAHIRRRDHLWKPLGFLLLTIHWFNPLMWLAYVLLCRDIELACDEKVIGHLGREQRADYTQALLTCSVNRPAIAACPLAFGEVSVKERVKAVLHYRKPGFWIVITAVIACAAVAVCFLTNPITIGDHFVLKSSDRSGDTNQLVYDIQLGNQTMSGEIYVEQWVDGTCVRSAPVVLTQYADAVDITMSERREDGVSVGTDIRIETNQYGGSLLTWFAHPENFHITGWAFTGYEMGETVKLSPDQEVILAAKVFDDGSGVRVFDCETLVKEPERLESAAYMIVVRAVFGEEATNASIEETASGNTPEEPAPQLSLDQELLVDASHYLELASVGKEFQNMDAEAAADILKEYEGLLEDYSLFPRESTDGTVAYILGAYRGDPEDNPFRSLYSMEFSLAREDAWQLLYQQSDSEAINQSLGEGKLPEAGYVIKNSYAHYDADNGLILILPRGSRLLAAVFQKYLAPGGRAYIADAVSRGVIFDPSGDCWLTVYLIHETYGELQEMLPLTREEAEAILTEERQTLEPGVGFAAALRIDGDTVYFMETTGVPQSVLTLATEKCGYKFSTPKDISEPIVAARLDCDWLDAPVYANESDLARLREILANAEFGYVGACGYGARLTITLSNGEEIIAFKGCDSCDTMVFGSYGGYFLGDGENQEFWKMFGLDPDTKALLNE